MASGIFDLTGKVALITGANSGIGLGYAEAIASAGGDVVIWGRREERNAQAAAQLESLGPGRVMTDAIDVTDESAQIAGFDRALERMGRLDCAIANAGFATLSPLAEMPLEQYEALVRVAQHGAFITLREAARRMIERSRAGEPGGSLIATGSLTNHTASPGVGHYAAAKGAVAGLIRTLALELGPHRIRANMLCAGYIRTEMVPYTDESEEGRMVAAQVPLGRMGTPADLAGMVVYLMSDASSYHTGDIITVDGGRLVNMG